VEGLSESNIFSAKKKIQNFIQQPYLILFKFICDLKLVQYLSNLLLLKEI